jgi:hypothetical protein
MVYMVNMVNMMITFPSLMIASPPWMIKKALETMTPIAAMVKDSACVIIAPTPRYGSRRCCTSTDHHENYKSENYESEI